MTKSPVSTWGVNSACSLPRKRLAALTATRPRTWYLASMSHHLRSTSLALAENVFISGWKRARKLLAGTAPVNRGNQRRFRHQRCFMEIIMRLVIPAVALALFAFNLAHANNNSSATDQEQISPTAVLRELNLARE